MTVVTINGFIFDLASISTVKWQQLVVDRRRWSVGNYRSDHLTLEVLKSLGILVT
ncbi:hypothetical protein J6590_008795 [Homalodisca vitripennis]|nr:hypothetical protein J6590_008795 [Homalodisca vitripennis]